MEANQQAITSMQAVTISRQYGSGGGEIAARLAQKLGWQLIDHAIIEQTARELGVYETDVHRYDEDIGEFLKDQPEVLQRILAQAKAPLKDAAVVNATRWELYRRLQALVLPVEGGTGGRTKYNRSIRHLSKTHWIDAARVGASTPETLLVKDIHPLLIKAMGHGSRQMCLMNKRGFPRTGPKQAKLVKGMQTGDMVKAIVTTGKKQRVYVGRVAVRSSGSFNVTTQTETVQGISYSWIPPAASIATVGKEK